MSDPAKGGTWTFTGQAVAAVPGQELVTVARSRAATAGFRVVREAVQAWGLFVRDEVSPVEQELRPLTASENGVLWYGPDYWTNCQVVGVFRAGEEVAQSELEAAAAALLVGA